MNETRAHISAGEIARIVFALAVSLGLAVFIWFAIGRYEGNPVFEGIVALSAVAVNVYMVFVCVRMIAAYFRSRR